MRALLIAFLMAPCAAMAQEFFTLKGHGGPIMDIAVSPSGEIATASFDNSVGYWVDGAPLWFEGHAAAVTAVAFFGDRHVFSGGDDNDLRDWSADGSGAVIDQHTAKVQSIAVSQTHGIIATASWDSTVGLSYVPGQQDWVVRPPDNRLWDRFARLKGHSLGVNDVEFSPDEALLYSASSDGTIRAWDIDAQAERQVLVKHGFGINEIVVGETWLAYGAVDGVTRVVDRETGAPIKDFTLGRRPILAMAYDGDGQMAVGDGEGYIMVIDTQNWKITRDFRATKQGPVWALAFSANGQNILAGGLEDIVYSWPVATMDQYDPMSSEPRSFLEDPDALPNGERQFKRKCSICHSLTSGSERKAGPTLFGLFGRPAGVVEDYRYSQILTGSDIIWSEETIDGLFDEGPDHYIPGTKMPMQRITAKQDRTDLIDYLKVATAGGEDQ